MNKLNSKSNKQQKMGEKEEADLHIPCNSTGFYKKFRITTTTTSTIVQYDGEDDNTTNDMQHHSQSFGFDCYCCCCTQKLRSMYSI